MTRITFPSAGAPYKFGDLVDKDYKFPGNTKRVSILFPKEAGLKVNYDHRKEMDQTEFYEVGDQPIIITEMENLFEYLKCSSDKGGTYNVLITY